MKAKYIPLIAALVSAFALTQPLAQTATPAAASASAPLATVAMGVLLLGEPLNAWIVAGTALVLSGVWLLAKAR